MVEQVLSAWDDTKLIEAGYKQHISELGTEILHTYILVLFLRCVWKQTSLVERTIKQRKVGEDACNRL